MSINLSYIFVRIPLIISSKDVQSELVHIWNLQFITLISQSLQQKNQEEGILDCFDSFFTIAKDY